MHPFGKRISKRHLNDFSLGMLYIPRPSFEVFKEGRISRKKQIVKRPNRVSSFAHVLCQEWRGFDLN
jgi:hypothetical protein